MSDIQGFHPTGPLKSLQILTLAVPDRRPSPERLQELLSYDPGTGALCWRHRGLQWWDTRYAGTAAGALKPEGYRQVRLDGGRWYAHVIAYTLAAGAWPAGDVDHVDLDKTNNRISNLRPASRRENEGNKPLRKDNKLRVKGVQVCPGGFRTRIRAHGRRIFLGVYDTPEEASAAYERAARKHFGEFARAA